MAILYVRWALSLAVELESENIIIEKDFKICHDAIHELSYRELYFLIKQNKLNVWDVTRTLIQNHTKLTH